jgi:hypothetical protein
VAAAAQPAANTAKSTPDPAAQPVNPTATGTAAAAAAATPAAADGDGVWQPGALVLCQRNLYREQV